MIQKLQFLFFVFMISNLSAQTPTIEGDLMMCPYTDGTAYITTDQEYDSYQWYFKYWFTSDEFEPIDGATGPSFTYDWYTYDQALLKVVVTLNGTTYESNSIQIDSYTWISIFTMYEMNNDMSIDPENGTILLCEGASFDLSVNNPPYDSSITWYKDGVAIDGATNSTYTVTGPGSYEVSAAPSFCPDSISFSIPVVVATDPDCSLGIPQQNLSNIKIYPNPASHVITVSSPGPASYTIADLTGKIISQGKIDAQGTISVSEFSNGVYLLNVDGDGFSTTVKFIKK